MSEGRTSCEMRRGGEGKMGRKPEDRSEGLAERMRRT